MRRVMTAACISDPRDLHRAILATGETRDALITELTIGETFFLREKAQFDFLRDSVLPHMSSATGHGRLRIWSAGCATGEEPYSLAILLREAEWPGTAYIVGTDLASARLAAARRARYTDWSMRGVSDAVVSRYFERRGKQLILNSAIRQAVDFRVLNLASEEYPSVESGLERMDIIFCRNVLIYFDSATVTAIASRLIDSLAPGGWLFLGASDPAIAELVPCEVVMTGAGLAYRRPEANAGIHHGAPDVVFRSPEPWEEIAGRSGPSVPPWATADVASATGTLEATIAWAAEAPDEPAPRDSYEAAYEHADYDAAVRLARIAIDEGNDTEPAWLVIVRSLANRGQLDAAAEACSTALEGNRLSAELTHLQAMLLAESGRHAEAAVVARRALYLNARYIVAHLALGDALSRTGDAASARRAFTNAVDLLKELAPDTPVAGADGAEALQLLRIARFRLDSLAVSAGGARAR